MKKIILFFLISCLILPLSAQQSLRRKASIGIRPEPLSQEMSEKTAYGLSVNQVFPATTAEAAGLQAGDILLAINGEKMTGMPVLFGISQELRAGDEVQMKILRGGKEKMLKAKAVGRPLEESEWGEVIYDEIPFQEGILRSIVNKPKEAGKRPAILFIPGYPCASYDGMSPIHPYRKLIDDFVQKGYVVMRVEKPGMGDGLFPTPCDQLSIETENDAFEAGYHTLAKYEFVDSENIFVFGHSLGGLSAPEIASRVQPKGVIVYGTAYEPWWEYLMRMLRVQNPLFGIDFVENEKDMRLYHHLLYKQYVLKQSPKDLAAENEEYGRLLRRDFQWDGEEMIFGRHYSFWNSVNDLPMTEIWKNTSCHVLSIYGEADVEALDPVNHQTIVDIVNHYHPGKARFALLEGTNHSMIEVGSMKEGVALRNSPQMRDYLMNNFSHKLTELCDEWMRGLGD